MKENYKNTNEIRVDNNFWSQLNEFLINKYATSELKRILSEWAGILHITVKASWDHEEVCNELRNIIRTLGLRVEGRNTYILFQCLEVLIDDTKFTSVQLNEFLRRNNVEYYYDDIEEIWKKGYDQNQIRESAMEIFLGSSVEAKEFMEEIALKLQELGNDTLMWTDVGKGIFVPGSNTIDALIDITKRVQAAIFIFNADDEKWNETSSVAKKWTVRENVIFEYGLFVGELGKKRVCFVCKGYPEIATDLKGITYIDGNQRPLIIKNKLKDWINGME